MVPILWCAVIFFQPCISQCPTWVIKVKDLNINDHLRNIKTQYIFRMCFCILIAKTVSMYVAAQFCNFYIMPFTPVISEVSVTLSIWGCQGLFLINDKSVINCITWHVIFHIQSVTAFSQPAKVTMVALTVEGSEPCRWHVVSQECDICGTSPELEGYAPMHDIFKAVIL